MQPEEHRRRGRRTLRAADPPGDHHRKLSRLNPGRQRILHRDHPHLPQRQRPERAHMPPGLRALPDKAALPLFERRLQHPRRRRMQIRRHALPLEHHRLLGAPGGHQPQKVPAPPGHHRHLIDVRIAIRIGLKPDDPRPEWRIAQTLRR